jgi:hypothetical protein
MSRTVKYVGLRRRDLPRKVWENYKESVKVGGEVIIPVRWW